MQWHGFRYICTLVFYMTVKLTYTRVYTKSAWKGKIIALSEVKVAYYVSHCSKVLFYMLCHTFSVSTSNNFLWSFKDMQREHITNVLYYLPNEQVVSKYNASGGSRISRRGGVDLVGGGVDSRGSYVSKILYVKTKELGPLGGRALGAPP